MRLVLQRVSRGVVRVSGETVGEIGRGILVLAGAERGDGAAQVAQAVEKLAHLRIFEDAQGKMNVDPAAAGAAFLVVSQFTLAGSLERGRRPSFDGAAPPDVARPLVEQLVCGLRARGFRVETGSFGAMMEVELVNDGPVTFVLDVAASAQPALTAPRGSRSAPA